MVWSINIQTSLHEANHVLPLSIRQDQLVPLVLLQPETLESVVLDEVHPDHDHYVKLLFKYAFQTEIYLLSGPSPIL